MHRTLLIADSNPRLRAAMAEALAGPDRSAVCVAGGLEAVERIAETAPDLLLCGDRLLDMQAQDLIARLEQRGGCPPYMIHSTVDSSAAAVAWIRRGALDYLVRDEDWTRRLAWRVEQLLAQADSARQLESARRQKRQASRLEQRLIDRLPGIAFVCDRRARVLVASGAAQSRGMRPGCELPGQEGSGTGWWPPAAVFRGGGALRREQELQGLLYEARWLGLDDDTALCLALDQGPRRQEDRDRRRLEGRRHLEQRMESLGELAGHLGHDVSNQLLVVTGYADLLLQSLPERATERGWVEGMRKAAENAVGQIRRLLAFTRVKGASFQTIDLHGLLRETVADLRHAHPRVRVRLALQAAGSSVAADAGRLKDALFQLAANGCEAMPGGGELVIETSNPAPASGDEPTHVQLVVRDQGTGMDEATVDRIFDPFFTTRKAQGGTGLGLSYAWGCLRSHRGTIDVRSRPGHGSEFRVLLPLSAPGATDDAPAAGHILLVDDDETVRAVVQSILKAAGCLVTAFGDGTSALDWVDGDHPPVDLALLDLRMPHMNGWELLEELHGRDPRLRALFMTGWSEDLDPERLGKRHVLGLLHKPFEIEELYTTVQGALATVRQERAEAALK